MTPRPFFTVIDEVAPPLTPAQVEQLLRERPRDARVVVWSLPPLDPTLYEEPRDV